MHARSGDCESIGTVKYDNWTAMNPGHRFEYLKNKPLWHTMKRRQEHPVFLKVEVTQGHEEWPACQWDHRGRVITSYIPGGNAHWGDFGLFLPAFFVICRSYNLHHCVWCPWPRFVGFLDWRTSIGTVMVTVQTCWKGKKTEIIYLQRYRANALSGQLYRV